MFVTYLKDFSSSVLELNITMDKTYHKYIETQDKECTGFFFSFTDMELRQREATLINITQSLNYWGSLTTQMKC
jgi:hypothetical protein